MPNECNETEKFSEMSTVCLMVVEQKINVFDVCDTLLNMAKFNKLAKHIELPDLPREL